MLRSRAAISICLFCMAAGPLLAAEPETRPRLRRRQTMVLPPGVKALRDLEYARASGQSLRLDLYLPEARGPVPVIVWIHGGGWRAGSKAVTPALRLTQRGYAVASIDYRLSHVAAWPAQIHDCKAAVRWLRAHAKEYGLAPDRIGAWGSSAGGHLAAMLGTSGDVKELEGDLGNSEYSSRVQAVCDWFGPTDFVAIARVLKNRGLASRENGSVSRLLGGPVEDNLDKARQASPVTWVSKDDPPFLIMHGAKDTLVPRTQSQLLCNALRRAEIGCILHMVADAGHGQGGFRTAEIAAMVDAFFDRNLKNVGTPASRPE